MSDNRRRYRAIKAAIMQLYPTEPRGNIARHLHTLAALVSGIVGSRSTNLPAIAGKAPDGTKRESRVKRFYRWMKNERIDAQVYFLLYADELLESLAADRPLLLAIVGREHSEYHRTRTLQIPNQAQQQGKASAASGEKEGMQECSAGDSCPDHSAG